MTNGLPPHQTVVAVVHRPVTATPPRPPGVLTWAVLRPHPDEPSPHPDTVGAVIVAHLPADATPRPAAWATTPVDAYLVDERVQIPGPARPEGGPIPGIVQCSFVRRQPSLTRADFAAHWNDVHAPLVPVHHPGVVRYVQHVVVEALTGDAPEVDGIALLHFATVDDFHDRYYDSEAGRALVAADVARFIDRPRGWRIHAQETRIPA